MLKQRFVGIDLLRTFAIFCVVLNHCTEKIYTMDLEGVSSLSQFSQVFAFLGFTLGRVGVPCFLVISGYLLMDRTYTPEQCKKFWKDSWFHLLVCTWIWFSIYDVILALQGQKITLDQYLYHLLFLEKVNFSHVWYMPAIIGIYLLIPVMSNGLRQIGHKQMMFVLVIYFGYSFVVPLLETVSAVTDGAELNPQFSTGFSGGAYGLYLLMGAMVKKGAFKRVGGPILALAVLVSYCATVWFQLWSYQNNHAYKVWYDFPLLLVMGVCLLELTSRIQTIPGKRLFAVLAKYSFAVYLIHNIILEQLKPWVVQQEWAMSLKVLLMFCVVSVFSYVVSFLVGGIPKVGAYALYLKGNRGFQRKKAGEKA